MNEKLRKTGRILGQVLLGVLALVTVLLVAIQTPIVKGMLLDSVIERVDQRFAGTIRADRLSGPLFWGVTLHNVRIRDKRDGPVVRMQEVEVDYSPLSLLREEIQVDEVTLREPLLVVRRYPDGAINLAETTKPGPPWEFAFELSRFRVVDGRLLYEEQPAEGDASGPSSPATEETREQSVTTILERHFESGGDIDLSSLQAAFDREPAPDEGRVVLADDVSMEGQLVMLPGGIARIELGSMGAMVDTRDLARPIELAGNAIQIEYAPDRAAIDIAELALEETSTLTGFDAAATFVPSSDKQAPEGTTELAEFSGGFEKLTVAPRLATMITPRANLAEPVTIEAEFGGEPDNIAYQATASIPEGGRIAVDGFTNPTVPAYEFSIDAADIDSRAWVDGTLPASSFDATAVVDGKGSRIDTLEGTARLEASNIEVGAYRASRLVADVTGKPGRVDLTTFEVASPYFGGTASGFLEADGDFRLQVSGETPKGGLPESLADRLGLKPEQIGNTTLSVNADGQLDLDNLQMPETLLRANLKTNWQMGALSLEATKVEASSGRIDVGLSPASNAAGNRRVTFDADGRFRGMSTASYGLDSGSATARGELTMNPRDGITLEALRTLTANTTFDFDGLTTPEFQTSGGDVTGKFERPTPGGDLQYVVDGSVANAKYGEYTAGRASLEAEGAIPPAPDGAEFPFKRLSADGRLGLSDYESPALSLGVLDADVSVDGFPLTAGDTSGFTVDGKASDVRMGAYSAATADVDLEGSVLATSTMLERRIEDFSIQGTIGATRLRTPDYSLDRIDSDVSLTGAPMIPGESVSYDVEGTAYRPTYGPFTSDTLEIDLAGSFVAAAETAEQSYRDLAAKGSVGLSQLRGYGFRVRDVETDIDLGGLVESSLGTLRTNFDSFGIGRVSFASGRFDIDLEKARNFRFETIALPSLLPNLPFFVRMGGIYANRLRNYDLDTVEVGRPGLTWSLVSPANVAFDDGKMTVKSLALRNLGRTVSVDGTYDLRDTDSLVGLFERLGLMQLHELFDLEELRKRLPADKLPGDLPGEAAEELMKRGEEVIKDAPKKLEEKAKEEVEKKKEELEKKKEEAEQKAKDKVKEELEKRLPDDAKELEKDVPKELEKKLREELQDRFFRPGKKDDPDPDDSGEK